MGCDIHMVIERNPWSDDWYCVGFDWYDECHYGVFSKLAGVRGRFDPISKPRGLPGDLSSYARSYFGEWGSDIHSTSWLTAREILDWDWDEIESEQLPIFFAMLRAISTLSEGWVLRNDEIDPLEKIRVVIGFDN